MAFQQDLGINIHFAYHLRYYMIYNDYYDVLLLIFVDLWTPRNVNPGNTSNGR